MLMIVVGRKDKVDGYALQQRHPLHRIVLQYTNMDIRPKLWIVYISGSTTIGRSPAVLCSIEDIQILKDGVLTHL
jgi:hypothetical protein